MNGLKGLIFVTTTAVLTMGATGFAQEQATIQDPSCIQVANDPYDIGRRMGPGSKDFAGKCVNSLSKRPAKIVRETSNSLTFANFYHDGQFWIAKWSKSDLPKVDFLNVHFDGGIPLVTMGHTEFRFRFNKGLELTSQTTGKHAVVKDLIVDWEATFIEGESYDFLAGVPNNYALTGRVLSTASRIPENIVTPGVLRKIDQYPLNLSKEVAATLFLKSVKRSDARSNDYFYLTIARNCTSELFNTIDPVMKEAGILGSRVRGFKTHVYLDPIIGPSVQALVARKLIGSKQPRQSFAAEFGFSEEK